MSRIIVMQFVSMDGVVHDERLELTFTCCHPALALEAQVALTLSALGGLETAEIGASPSSEATQAPNAKASVSSPPTTRQ